MRNPEATRNIAGSSALQRAGLQRLSDKQVEIMRVLRAGNGRDASGRFDPCDLDELLDRVNYKPSKDSMHFSIRALVRRGLIEKGERVQRRGRSRATLLPTTKGWTHDTFAGSESIIETPPAEVTETAHGVEDVIDSLQTLLD